MTDITIPPEALEAFIDFLSMFYRDGEGNHVSDAHARDACLAMLEAWPGMYTAGNVDGNFALLPLTEKPNDH